jgi:hypothetical protein
VVLAKVTLPASPTIALAEADIDNRAVRRMLFSVAMIQDQLIRCCCGDKPVPQPQPAASADVEIIAKESSQVATPNVPGAPAGKGVQFIFEVHNKGASTADNVTVKVQTTPPMDGAQYMWLTNPAWTPVGGDPKNGIVASLGSLAVNAVKQVSFTAAIVRRPVTITAIATASSSTSDPDLTNNVAKLVENFA